MLRLLERQAPSLLELQAVQILQGWMITKQERWAHPTTADVMQYLDMSHCEECEAWGTGLNAWWTDPNTVQGREQLDAIGKHIWETYGNTAATSHAIRDGSE